MTAISNEPTADPIQQFLARKSLVNWEVAIYIVILLLAIFTRFYALGDRVMSHDESLHTRYSYNLYADGDFQHTPLMHGPILFHVTAFMYFLFGDNDFTSRIYPAALGVLVTLMPLLFRRWIGRYGALLASIMLLISPLMLYYNRYIRHDTPSIFFALLMIYAMMMYINGGGGERRQAKWTYLMAGAMIGNLGSKETAFIYIAIIGSFLTLYWLVRMAQRLWNLPGKTIFYTLSITILLGGVAALGIYVAWSIVSPEQAAVASEASGLFGSLASSSFVLWTVMIFAAMLVFVLGPLVWAFRNGAVSIRWSDVLIVILLVVVFGAALIEIERLSHVSPPSAASETAPPPVPGENELTIVTGVRVLPLVLAWVGGAVGLLVLFVLWRTGWWAELRVMPEFEMMILMGSLILPWLTPVILAAMGASPTDQSQDGIVRAIIAAAPLTALAVAGGLMWHWRRWLICVAIFYAIFLFFFTTMLRNMNGIGTGIISSLGYWLEQQGVRRGSQPQYYYLGLVVPFYEFLPVLGSIFAMFSGLTLYWGFRRDRLVAQARARAAELDRGDDAVEIVDAVVDLEDELPPDGDLALSDTPLAESKPRRVLDQAERLDRLPFMLFVGWWAILNLIGYTLAGEKMPWLGTHLTLPLIFLTGWYLNRLILKIDTSRLKSGGWLALILLPVMLLGLFQVVSPFFFGQIPFLGLEQQQLAQSGQWLGALGITGLIVLGVLQLGAHIGWRHLRQMLMIGVFAVLALVTTRSALLASFVNYDLATEYLVYAHAAPAVKWVLDDLEELSMRTTDGMDLSFAYDNEVSWPYSWYFRHFRNAHFVGSSPSRPIIDQSVAVVVGEKNRAAVEPLLEDRYYHFDFIRLWWPMQDYFNLTAERVAGLFDFSPDNLQAGQLRQGLFDIWWSRDYSTYGQAVGRNFEVTSWPVSDRMHFYVRKDIAVQIWDLGVGEGTVENPLDDLVVNVCNSNWQLMAAQNVFGSSGSAAGQLNRPLDLSVDAEGNIYVAEESNNRVSVFDREGNLLRILGQGDEPFIRPNGLALNDDGSLVVADTWNYQIKQLSSEGALLDSWGQPGEFGAAAPVEPVDGFWGPRDVAVDSEGNVYVADTGNKRIRVYRSDGEYLRDIGMAGSAPGQLDEPSGITIHPDGRLFIADYWNRRVTVYNIDGTFMYNFPVRAWYDEQGNRPYLAVDTARDYLYVTDPDAGRVLVFTTSGECLGSFGQASSENVDATRFRTTAGVAVDAEGNIYVTDSGTGRILKFLPFDPGEAVILPDENLPLPETTEEVVG